MRRIGSSGRLIAALDFFNPRPYIAGAWILALATAGCTVGRYYTNTPLQGDPAALIQGQSTKGDVLRLFGPPTRITHQTGGDAFVYTYQQLNTSTFRVQDPVVGYNWFTYNRQIDRRDTLVVLFDFTGIVRSYAVNHHVEDMPPL